MLKCFFAVSANLYGSSLQINLHGTNLGVIDQFYPNQPSLAYKTFKQFLGIQKTILEVPPLKKGWKTLLYDIHTVYNIPCRISL
jgi:hypothetical protein